MCFAAINSALFITWVAFPTDHAWFVYVLLIWTLLLTVHIIRVATAAAPSCFHPALLFYLTF